MEKVTFALPKGRLLKEAVDFLSSVGIDASEVLTQTRKLIFEWEGYRFLLVKPMDVPTYVYYAAADLGIAGKDVIEEKGYDLYEPFDLGFGACRLSVAEPVNAPEPYDLEKLSYIRVATKYPRITDAYFRSKGIHPEIITLYGSVELAPLVGLTDRIVDLVQTGNTLKANGLKEVDTILHSTARLIVNKASLKTKYSLIKPILDRVKGKLLTQK
ncbi:ATP phosphoribosyltransferase [Thermovibrio ammonificans]|uniref:ATP phosphoribosyltransferase n=1 Tax=Thermovibrio ammonificans (strain DSM 15698 / JCM 12110 / HB-1) TaxID=648996 RepID=E8T6K8_THEA1|nr:ATP phosphoribosyltransferase [Thermovibrio ammonificans]ADU96792.1 ATP phosphoribosyltransferase [Thermovibrio ammonificans HB-1]